MIRVLISAASAIVRSGLEAVVRSHELLEFAGAVSVAGLQEGKWQEEGADAVLVALASPNEEQLRNLAEVPCSAVLLTDEPESSLLSGSLRGVLHFDAKPEEIGAALVAAAEGLWVVQAEGFGRRPVVPAQMEEALTQREREVLRMLSEGLSNKLIAHGLQISEHTVKFHVAQVMGKLRAGSRTDAVMQGIRRGLILI